MENNAAFTIVNGAYLGFALTLADSFLDRNPGHDFFIFLLDLLPQIPLARDGLNILVVDDKILEDLEHRAFYYEITELSTSIKPNCFAYLFRDYNKVVYLDPDIYIISPMKELFTLLDIANIVITPHSTTPIYDTKMPDDLNFLRAGAYNLGFLALSKSAETLRFIEWWSERLKVNSFNSFSKGMFTDQKWIDLVPSYFDGVMILKNPGYNVAYWNLHERKISKDFGYYTVNGVPLIFFHFSGVSYKSDLVSKYATRFGCYTDLYLDISLLFNEYLIKLEKNTKMLGDEYKKEYIYNVFADGAKITNIQRMIYFYYYLENTPGKNPFSLKSREFANYISNFSSRAEEVIFTKDYRIERVARKMKRLPNLGKALVRKISEKEVSSKALSLTNNAFNKLNITRILYTAYDKE